MKNYKEQRKHKRLKVKFRVNCKSEGVFFSDFTRDIGLGGIGIETATILRVGTMVELFVQLPGESESIILKGKVVWANVNGAPKENASNIALGIRFEDLPEHYHSKLLNYIEQHDKNNLEV